MRAFIFCRYCPPIVFCPQIWKAKTSSKIESNALGILRRSFFSFNALGMPSFNNSVVLTLFCKKLTGRSFISKNIKISLWGKNKYKFAYVPKIDNQQPKSSFQTFYRPWFLFTSQLLQALNTSIVWKKCSDWWCCFPWKAEIKKQYNTKN